MALGSDYRTFMREFYVSLLAFADAHQTFPRFFDLPSELRNTIYNLLCVSHSPKELQRLEHPAICHASKQLRNESLPIFFSKNMFLLVIHTKYFDGQTKIGLRYEDRKWLDCNAIQIPQMRNFGLDLAMWSKWTRYYPYMCLTLSKDAKSVRVRRDEMNLVRNKEERREERLAERLQDAINSVVGRGEGLDDAMLSNIIVTVTTTFTNVPVATEKLAGIFGYQSTPMVNVRHGGSRMEVQGAVRTLGSIQYRAQ